MGQNEAREDLHSLRSLRLERSGCEKTELSVNLSSCIPEKAGVTFHLKEVHPIKKPAKILVPEPLPGPVAAVTFPIVGIGASAGGLAAIELFLQNVPQHSGMAFVIVQHLDPTHKCMMAELLQRITPMTVLQVKNRTKVHPDCVYVIPPNKDMSILQGVLHLHAPMMPRGQRLPIDFFFKSLADDLEAHSIGVLLSGMGSDGTLGLKAIKEKSGTVFVQDPATASFDSMPRNIIETGIADVVGPAETLPGKIIAYLRLTPRNNETHLSKTDIDHSAFDKIATLLRAKTGQDFSLYKKNTVYRRIERRIGTHQIDRIATYTRFLQENPQELELLFRELLIGVTSFFRDPAAWGQLETEVIPALLKDCPPAQALRVWVPACSTGEEAYSLAILFREAQEKFMPGHKPLLQIFASDLDKDAIAKARTGFYLPGIKSDVSPGRLNRFFVKVEGGYLVSKTIRETVIFAVQNVIMDPPFTKLNLVSCRNLLIYLLPELQKKLLPLFHYSLRPGGVLFLGNAETCGEFTDLFAPLAGKSYLYRRLESVRSAELIEFPATFPPARTVKVPLPQGLQRSDALQTQAEQLLLQRYSPAAVLVNDKGDIIFINGRTGKYMEPAAGKANWNLFSMVREGLRYDLNDAFRKALRQKEAIVRKNVKIETDGRVLAVDLTIQSITEPETLRGLVMVVFTDVATPPEVKRPATTCHTGSSRTAVLAQELEKARLELQTVREEVQTFQEEAKSANEEMQSTNEEMQSTNEELTTSTEEMLSMNEELRTLSAELQRKVEDLSRLNSDMKNLLDGTDVATLFLDGTLRVRLFTSGVNRIFKLIPGDIGRLITDIASELIYPELATHAREVLRTLVVHEQPATTHDGCRFRVRIIPYRTLENMIDGVVITLVDVTTEFKQAEALRKANDMLRLAIVVRDAHDAITVQDLDGRILAWNPGAVRLYGWSEAEALAMNVSERIPINQREQAMTQLTQLYRSKILAPYLTQRLKKDGTAMAVWMTATALMNEAGHVYAISTTERAEGSKP